jgi:glyoxylase-like metal-dependent hydrolase (beta-lactamase superfamily II)
MAYRGIIPGHFPTGELKRSRVMQITPDIWMIEGYISTNFFFKPPSCNCFILRDKDMVLLVDTGTYPFYREPILEILRMHRRDGAKRLVLMLTQGHFDHVANNDVILEAGYTDVRFLLPEVELSTIDMYHHWTGEYIELMEYYDPYRQMPIAFPTTVVNLASRVSTRLAQAIFSQSCKTLFKGINTMVDQAEILPSDSREKRIFGDVEVMGWEVGRFFAVHDATHSPGHLSFYDPQDKVFLTGDATLEINPAFFNSSVDRCIEAMAAYVKLAEQGYVEIATDAHRSSIWSQRLAEEMCYDALDRIQMVDLAMGREECVAFYQFFLDYYAALKDVVLGSLSRLGEATVPELVEEFGGSDNPYARFKTRLVFPRIPSRLDFLIANVLKEAEAPRRREGDRIVFSPSR